MVTFMKSSEDIFVGWLHEYILPCQLCPGARVAAGFELREDFQVAIEQWSHRIEFWHGSSFNQWQRLHFAGVIVQPGIKSIAREVGVRL